MVDKRLSKIGREMEENLKCPKCGAALDSKYRFCPLCNYRLGDKVEEKPPAAPVSQPISTVPAQQPQIIYIERASEKPPAHSSSKNTNRTIGIILAVIILIAGGWWIISDFTNVSSAFKGIGTSPVVSTPASQPIVQTPIVQPTPITLKEWSGTGNKNTETFHISSSPWTVEWLKTPTDSSPLLMIEIYRPGEQTFTDYISSGTSNPGIQADTGYIYETGTFYLNITGLSCNWDVKVIGVP